MAELADAPDLGSGGDTREGSSPFARTNMHAGAMCEVEQASFTWYHSRRFAPP